VDMAEALSARAERTASIDEIRRCLA